MFPNVRLMIAAVFASIVALICGFGIFAALRVSHEPLVRLPPATAPLQLVADNAAKSSVAFAPGEPFNGRFQIGNPPSAVAAKDSPYKPDRHDEAEPAPGAVTAPPEPGTAEAEETTSVVGEPKEQAALPVAEATEQPMVGVAVPTANDQTAVAFARQPEPAPAAASDAAVAPASSDARAADAGQEIKAPVVFEPTGEPASAAAPVTAAIEPLANPPLPPQRPKSAPKPGSASVTTETAEPAYKTADKAATKKTDHTHFSARAHRARRIASAGAQTTNQNSGFSQSNFQTAPQASEPQLAPRRAVRIHRSKLASGRTKTSNSASGGPFVSPPRR
jgi:hypothetical protein